MSRIIRTVTPIAGRLHVHVTSAGGEYTRLHPANCVDHITCANVHNMITFNRIYACHITSGMVNDNFSTWRDNNIGEPEPQPNQFEGERPVAYATGYTFTSKADHEEYMSTAYTRSLYALPEINGLQHLYRSGTKFTLNFEYPLPIFSWVLGRVIRGKK